MFSCRVNTAATLSLRKRQSIFLLIDPLSYLLAYLLTGHGDDRLTTLRHLASKKDATTLKAPACIFTINVRATPGNVSVGIKYHANECITNRNQRGTRTHAVVIQPLVEKACTMWAVIGYVFWTLKYIRKRLKN